MQKSIVNDMPNFLSHEMRSDCDLGNPSTRNGVPGPRAAISFVSNDSSTSVGNSSTCFSSNSFFMVDSAYVQALTEEAGNKCRNPDHDDTIWCYTTDPDQRWEFCDPA